MPVRIPPYYIEDYIYFGLKCLCSPCIAIYECLYPENKDGTIILE